MAADISRATSGNGGANGREVKRSGKAKGASVDIQQLIDMAMAAASSMKIVDQTDGDNCNSHEEADEDAPPEMFFDNATG